MGSFHAVVKLSGPFRSSVAGPPYRDVDPFIAAQVLSATLNACAELGYLVPDVRPKAAVA